MTSSCCSSLDFLSSLYLLSYVPSSPVSLVLYTSLVIINVYFQSVLADSDGFDYLVRSLTFTRFGNSPELFILLLRRHEYRPVLQNFWTVQSAQMCAEGRPSKFEAPFGHGRGAAPGNFAPDHPLAHTPWIDRNGDDGEPNFPPLIRVHCTPRPSVIPCRTPYTSPRPRPVTRSSYRRASTAFRVAIATYPLLSSHFRTSAPSTTSDKPPCLTPRLAAINHLWVGPPLRDPTRGGRPVGPCGRARKRPATRMVQPHDPANADGRRGRAPYGARARIRDSTPALCHRSGRRACLRGTARL